MKTESFSWQRFLALFAWQSKGVSYNRHILISILIVIVAFLNGNRHNTDVNTYHDKTFFFIIIIVFSTNFFRHLTSGGSIAPFLLLPSSVAEKYLFLLLSVVILPMSLIFGLVEMSELLSIQANRISDTQHVLFFGNYMFLFLFASFALFVHCLPQKKWTIGISSLFLLFFIPLGIGYFKLKSIQVPILSDAWSVVSHPFFTGGLALGVLVLGYFFFQQNEVCRFKKYE
jgi:hypothetical protein